MKGEFKKFIDDNEYPDDWNDLVVRSEELKAKIDEARKDFPRDKLSIYKIDTETLIKLRYFYDKWFGDE